MNADAVPEATRKMLATLWEKNLPVVQGRVEELVCAADAAARGTLDAESRQASEATAHKLAGSLGMFGYKRGTEIAREMEQTLEGDAPLHGERLQVLAGELKAELRLT